MNIFDLQYTFKIIEPGEIVAPGYSFTTRIDIAGFVLNNTTDATIDCHLEKDGKRIHLTRMEGGYGYSNSKDSALRHIIPAGTTVTFTYVGTGATQGSLYVTAEQ